MFRLTMCQCLRKLFKVGSLFKLLFAYNTFVPFSLRESQRPRFTHATRRLYAVTTHTLFTATGYPSLQDCKTRSAKHDSLPTGCIY